MISYILGIFVTIALLDYYRRKEADALRKSLNIAHERQERAFERIATLEDELKASNTRAGKIYDIQDGMQYLASVDSAHGLILRGLLRDNPKMSDQLRKFLEDMIPESESEEAMVNEGLKIIESA